MCGRFQLLPDGRTEKLLHTLKTKGKLRCAGDIAPGATISAICELDHGRAIVDATWWLLLDAKTHKPDYRYPSFNTRSDKLDSPRSLGYAPFRHSRCIIPASAFVEGLGDRKTYHKIEFEDRAIAFGGLLRTQVDRDSGEVLRSASIITLPPLPEWQHIHPKSLPLMLDLDDEALLDDWLDPGCTEVERFRDCLVPTLRHPQRITPIDRPSRWQPVGESFTLAP